MYGMNIAKQLTTLEQVATDVLIVGVQKHREQMSNWSALPAAFGEHINDWLHSGEISSEAKVITKLPIAGKAVKQILFVGLGEGKKLTAEVLRNAFGLVGKQLKASKKTAYTIWLESFVTEQVTEEEAAFLAGEGIGLGFYKIKHYKTTSNEPDTYLEEVQFVASSAAEAVAANYEIGHIYAEATNEARTLVNTPPNLLTATDLANYAEELGKQYGFEVEILNKAQMEELGMGAILSVNKGSVQEPRMITLKYKATEQWEDVVSFVGKGVTYDTGGYSLKPRDGMIGMKGDMGGAAAVLGAMKIIGETRPNKNVMAVIGSTDNMISGEALKPDDVITTLSGKTVEVFNTDAEGRLVLADAVTYAKQQGASYLIDVATLTGGVIVALGNDKTGALTNNEPFFESFMEATVDTNEFVWRLPLTENDKKRIRNSEFADLNNSPGRDGHMIFGGGFIGEFAEETPWIHLDIAGTSDASAAYDLGPKGGTGVMVRTLASFIEQLAEEE